MFSYIYSELIPGKDMFCYNVKYATVQFILPDEDVSGSADV